MKIREIFRLTWLPVVGASLCCLSPVIIVLLGLGTVTVGGSLADTLYGEYKWIFRSIGLVLLVVALVLHFRKKGICTLDSAKRHRNEILNTVLLTLFAGVVGYIVFLYVIVHYIGVWLGLWV
ncbi:hypothetical protein COU76_04680 [Candidatus Peregrinibacteria bacterium CG10_big_fil_rev_8_21_14_0_10_49_10]|nr:MAG: hypothetical protein COU76_04680 [Candidatus Peregrinibacteria bacterium CG10_big_fil_rev_8_21_14_0_10_49_10]